MFELAFIQIVAGCLVGVALAGLRRVRTARRRRWMARHPAPTFVFADLVGYTALTEECGDETAARVAREFRRTISGLSREHGAWQVKSMGDGAMIWSPDAAGAVALAARLVEEVGVRPDLLPVRVGVHTGPRGHARRRLVRQRGQRRRPPGGRGERKRGADQLGHPERGPRRPQAGR